MVDIHTESPPLVLMHCGWHGDRDLVCRLLDSLGAECLPLEPATDLARLVAEDRLDLVGAADAVRLARRTLRTIRGNLAWAFGYNVAALPLAAAGLPVRLPTVVAA